MIKFAKQLEKEFSDWQINYPPSYRDYKGKFLSNLKGLSSSSFGSEYWKNIDFSFLDHEWELSAKKNKPDVRLLEDYIANLVGKGKYIDIVIVNGLLHSIDHIPSNTLHINKIYDHQPLFDNKQKISTNFVKQDLSKNWLLCLNELTNDELIKIKVLNDKQLKQTLRFIFITDNETSEPVTCPQIYIETEPSTNLDIIEEHFSLGKSLNNHSIKIKLAEKSSIRHFLFQNESETGVHINYTLAELASQANYQSYVLQKGAMHSIVQKIVYLNGEEASCALHGLSETNNEQKINNLTTVVHSAPNTQSNQDYRGILENQATLNFMGLVTVLESASGTNSSQLNQNLVLSKESKSNSRPRLEIENDNVKCTHGATSREVSEEELFYLKSRGISQESSKKLLTKAFAQGFFKKLYEIYPEWSH